MKQTLKLLICESNKNVKTSYTDYFADKNVHLEFCDKNGRILLEKIMEFCPDVVVCELFLAELDAISVIEKALKAETHPSLFFATSAIDNDEIIKRALDSGFNFFFIKPYSPESVLSKINLMLDDKDSETADPESFIADILHKMNMPSHLKGYSCIKDGTKLLLNNPSLVNSITKELYPQIAVLNNTTASRVERAIRTAIEITIERGDNDMFSSLFPYHHRNFCKPSNSEFMATIADYVRAESKKRKIS